MYGRLHFFPIPCGFHHSQPVFHIHTSTSLCSSCREQSRSGLPRLSSEASSERRGPSAEKEEDALEERNGGGSGSKIDYNTAAAGGSRVASPFKEASDSARRRPRQRVFFGNLEALAGNFTGRLVGFSGGPNQISPGSACGSVLHGCGT